MAALELLQPEQILRDLSDVAGLAVLFGIIALIALLIGMFYLGDRLLAG